MPEPAPPPKDYATPQDRLAGQDWSGVAKTGLASMAPADKGWVLAVVIIIAILQGGDYFSSARMADRMESSMTAMRDYLELVEKDRAQGALSRTQERQELLRIIETLTATVSRQANRAGRALTSQQAVDQLIGGAVLQKESLANPPLSTINEATHE